MYDPSFCNDSNISSCFQVLISELEILNIPVVAYEPGTDKLVVFLLNVAWSFATNRKRLVVRLNEQNETIANLKERVIFLEDNNRKFSSSLEKEKEQIVILTDTLMQLKSEKDHCISDIRNAKKEVTSLRGILSKQQIQFEHDVRRKNRLIEDLKLKLFNVLDPASRNRNGRTNIKGNSDVLLVEDKQLANKCILNLQNNIQLLLTENVELRNTLIKIYESLIRKNSNLPDDEVSGKKEKLIKLPYLTLLTEIEKDILANLSL